MKLLNMLFDLLYFDLLFDVLGALSVTFDGLDGLFELLDHGVHLVAHVVMHLFFDK